LCPDHELCITRRCLVDDLGMDTDTSFEDALRHPIVKAFRTKRCSNTGLGKTVDPEVGDDTLYHLGAGEDHRGATWYDADNAVVWLCGYGWHRSGDPGDAFKQFAGLIESGEIYPEEHDYRLLFTVRARRFGELAPADAQEIRERALRDPGSVQTGRLGRRLDVRVRADVLGDLAEFSVAFAPAGFNQQEIAFVLRCFAPDPDASLSEVADTLAGEDLLPGEIAFDLITSP
jgi:hypothetical protein